MGGRRTRTQGWAWWRSGMAAVARGAGRRAVRRPRPVQATVPGIVVVQAGVMSKVRQIKGMEEEVEKQEGSVMGWVEWAARVGGWAHTRKGKKAGRRAGGEARQEERAGPGPLPPQQLSLQQGRQVAVAVVAGRRRARARAGQLRERRSL